MGKIHNLEEREKVVTELLNEKMQETTDIDFKAYASGLTDMFNRINETCNHPFDKLYPKSANHFECECGEKLFSLSN